MYALRSKSWRLALLPIMLLAALLLPTLHLHSAYEHDGDGHVQQHAIIHADFLSTPAQEHGHWDREDVVVSRSHFADFSQSNFSALTARADESRTVKPTQAPRFLALDIEKTYPRLAQFARAFKQEHPPPPFEAYHTPSSPRSPPVLA